jgi:hypothetical protein
MVQRAVDASSFSCCSLLVLSGTSPGCTSPESQKNQRTACRLIYQARQWWLFADLRVATSTPSTQLSLGVVDMPHVTCASRLCRDLDARLLPRVRTSKQQIHTGALAQLKWGADGISGRAARRLLNRGLEYCLPLSVRTTTGSVSTVWTSHQQSRRRG